jgi:hypothetical protein
VIGLQRPSLFRREITLQYTLRKYAYFGSVQVSWRIVVTWPPRRWHELRRAERKGMIQLALLLCCNKKPCCSCIYCRANTWRGSVTTSTAVLLPDVALQLPVLCHEIVLQLALPVFLWRESQETIDYSYAVTRFHNKLTLILCYDEMSGRRWKELKGLENAWSYGLLVVLPFSQVAGH